MPPQAKPEPQEKGHSFHALSSTAAGWGFRPAADMLGGGSQSSVMRGSAAIAQRWSWPNRKSAPYGSWSSPITSELIVAASIGLGEIQLDGDDVYWLESRPQEGGRSVLVRSHRRRGIADVTPPAPGDGGRRSVCARGCTNMAAAPIWSAPARSISATMPISASTDRSRGSAPVPITPQPGQPRGLRYADGVMDGRRGRMIWVREDHTTGAREPVNTLVEIPLDLSQPQRVLQAGRDFYAAPRLSPDLGRLAWLEWDHPSMPWIGCELWVGEIGDDGSVERKWRVAGGDDESIFQPEWSPDGALYFISDRAQPGLDGRWWNLFRARGDAIEPVYPLAAEFGRPQWNFRMSTFAFDTAQSLVCSYVENGVHRLSTVDLASLAARPIATPFQDLSSVRAVGGRVYFRGGSPADPPSIVELDLGSGEQQNTKAVDHPGHRALPRLSVGAGAGDLRHREWPAGPRPLLPAAQRRFRRIRGRIAAADRALPWRPDRRRLGDLELGHAILDQPRLCGARRQLRRQHRLWPRIPAAAARQLGDRRRRRLRQRRALSGATYGGRSTPSAGRSAAAAPAATPRSRC